MKLADYKVSLSGEQSISLFDLEKLYLTAKDEMEKAIVSAFSTSQKATYVDSIVFNRFGQFLILKRTATATFMPGKWCLPGGHLELSDLSLIEGAKRELVEETNIITDEENTFTTDQAFNFSNPDGSHTHYFVFSASDTQTVLQIEEQAYSEWIFPNEVGSFDFLLDLETRLRDILSKIVLPVPKYTELEKLHAKVEDQILHHNPPMINNRVDVGANSVIDILEHLNSSYDVIKKSLDSGSISTKDYLQNYLFLKNEEIEKALDDEEARDFFEKGRKAADINKRMERPPGSGRWYIRTAQGWKWYGKGNGIQAQHHEMAAIIYHEDGTDQKKAAIKKQQSDRKEAERQAGRDDEATNGKIVPEPGHKKEIAGRMHIRTHDGKWKFYGTGKSWEAQQHEKRALQHREDNNMGPVDMDAAKRRKIPGQRQPGPERTEGTEPTSEDFKKQEAAEVKEKQAKKDKQLKDQQEAREAKPNEPKEKEEEDEDDGDDPYTRDQNGADADEEDLAKIEEAKRQRIKGGEIDESKLKSEEKPKEVKEPKKVEEPKPTEKPKEAAKPKEVEKLKESDAKQEEKPSTSQQAPKPTAEESKAKTKDTIDYYTLLKKQNKTEEEHSQLKDLRKKRINQYSEGLFGKKREPAASETPKVEEPKAAKPEQKETKQDAHSADKKAKQDEQLRAKRKESEETPNSSSFIRDAKGNFVSTDKQSDLKFNKQSDRYAKESQKEESKAAEGKDEASNSAKTQESKDKANELKAKVEEPKAKAGSSKPKDNTPTKDKHDKAKKAYEKHVKTLNDSAIGSPERKAFMVKKAQLKRKVDENNAIARQNHSEKQKPSTEPNESNTKPSPEAEASKTKASEASKAKTETPKAKEKDSKPKAELSSEAKTPEAETTKEQAQEPKTEEAPKVNAEAPKAESPKVEEGEPKISEPKVKETKTKEPKDQTPTKAKYDTAIKALQEHVETIRDSEPGSPERKAHDRKRGKLMKEITANSPFSRDKYSEQQKAAAEKSATEQPKAAESPKPAAESPKPAIESPKSENPKSEDSKPTPDVDTDTPKPGPEKPKPGPESPKSSSDDSKGKDSENNTTSSDSNKEEPKNNKDQKNTESKAASDSAKKAQAKVDRDAKDPVQQIIAKTEEVRILSRSRDKNSGEKIKALNAQIGTLKEQLKGISSGTGNVQKRIEDKKVQEQEAKDNKVEEHLRDVTNKARTLDDKEFNAPERKLNSKIKELKKLMINKTKLSDDWSDSQKEHHDERIKKIKGEIEGLQEKGKAATLGDKYVPKEKEPERKLTDREIEIFTKPRTSVDDDSSTTLRQNNKFFSKLMSREDVIGNFEANKGSSKNTEVLLDQSNKELGTNFKTLQEVREHLDSQKKAEKKKKGVKETAEFKTDIQKEADKNKAEGKKPNSDKPATDKKDPKGSSSNPTAANGGIYKIPENEKSDKQKQEEKDAEEFARNYKTSSSERDELEDQIWGNSKNKPKDTSSSSSNQTNSGPSSVEAERKILTDAINAKYKERDERRAKSDGYGSAEKKDAQADKQTELSEMKSRLAAAQATKKKSEDSKDSKDTNEDKKDSKAANKATEEDSKSKKSTELDKTKDRLAAIAGKKKETKQVAEKKETKKIEGKQEPKLLGAKKPEAKEGSESFDNERSKDEASWNDSRRTRAGSSTSNQQPQKGNPDAVDKPEERSMQSSSAEEKNQFSHNINVKALKDFNEKHTGDLSESKQIEKDENIDEVRRSGKRIGMSEAEINKSIANASATKKQVDAPKTEPKSEDKPKTENKQLAAKEQDESRLAVFKQQQQRLKAAREAKKNANSSSDTKDQKQADQMSKTSQASASNERRGDDVKQKHEEAEKSLSAHQKNTPGDGGSRREWTDWSEKNHRLEQEYSKQDKIVNPDKYKEPSAEELKARRERNQDSMREDYNKNKDNKYKGD